MRPDALSVLAAIIAIGSLDVVSAQNAEQPVDRPRYYFPKEVKRTIRNSARSADNGPDGLLDSVFDNVFPDQSSTFTPEVTAPPVISHAAAQEPKGQAVVMVTLSVDPKNPGVTHRITGTTTIGGEPTATVTSTTQQIEAGSTENTESSADVASSDEINASKQTAAAIASQAPTVPAAPSGGNLLGDAGAGLNKLLGGDSATSSAAPAATSTAAPVVESSAQVSSDPAPASKSGGNLLGDVGVGLNNLLGGDSETSMEDAAVSTAAPVKDPAAQVSSPPAPVSSSGGNLLGDVGAGLNNLLGGDSKTSMEDAAVSTAAPVKDPAAQVSSPPAPVSSSGGNLLGDVGAGLNNLLGGDSKTSMEDAVASTAAPVSDLAAQVSSAPAPVSSSGGNLLGDVGAGLNNLLGGDSTTSAAPPPAGSVTPASSATPSSGGNILSDLGSDVGDLLGVNSKTSNTASSDPAAQASTTPASTTAASGPNILGGIGTDLDNLLGGPTSSSAPVASSNSSEASPSLTSSGSDLLGILGLGGDNSATESGTIPVSIPASATNSLPGAPTSGGLLGGLASGVDSLIGATGSNGLIPTLLPGSNTKSSGLIPTIPSIGLGLGGGSTALIPTPTDPIGSIPVPHSTGSDPTATSATVPGSGLQDTSNVPAPTSHIVSTPIPVPSYVDTSKTAAEPQTTQTEISAPPTTNDNDWMPSTILIMPTVPTTQSSTSEGETAKPKPTSLPGSITPSNEVTEAPADTILLQIGFNSQLPWAFVATTPLSSSQIFNYTPQAIEFALPSLSANDVPVMFAIEPYYNWQATGYNATLAIFYFPRDKVDALRTLKSNPNSALYNQDSESIQSLMAMVDPTIPLEFSGNYPNGSGSSSDSHSESGKDNNDDGDDHTGGDGSASSSKTKASSIGIGVGVVAGAAAYGAGMFWVARRYRKRKQLHRRSNSTDEQMSHNDVAPDSMLVAGGGTLSPSHGSRATARSQMISAPVMAENSLGWN